MVLRISPLNIVNKNKNEHNNVFGCILAAKFSNHYAALAFWAILEQNFIVCRTNNLKLYMSVGTLLSEEKK